MGAMMSDFLRTAVAAARLRACEAAATRPFAEVREAALAQPPAPSLAAALSAAAVAVVAEVKRASPSRGALAEIPDPAALASAYVAGGAAAVSVLTEPRWFRGSLDDLAAVCAAVRVPVVRKDFVVTPYQVWEGRAAGAAAVLLILAALDDAELLQLRAEANEAGLEAFMEVHDAAEAARAGRAAAEGAPAPLVVGVNARDMATLDVDPERFARLRAALPDGAVTVAESGIRGAADLARLRALGADAVLVGELVATAHDPQAAVRDLLAHGQLTPAEPTRDLGARGALR